MKYTRQQPVRFTKFPFEPTTMLAPMEGLTNVALRDAIVANGAVGVVCTEFIRISEHAVSPKKMRRHVIKSTGVPLSVQVMGNDADLMADSAVHLVDAGADIVDVNLGCPTSKAAKGNVGAAMLRDPDLLYRVLSEMRQAIPDAMFSAKIRAGYSEADHILTICSAVEAAGVDFISVHPRRAVDVYDGKADWRIIALIKETIRIPVVGNGDILFPEDALRMRRDTHCDAIMIGRGAMRNPWIFRQIEELDAGQTLTRPNGQAVFDWLSDYFLALQDYQKKGPTELINSYKEIIRLNLKLLKDDNGLRSCCLRQQTFPNFMQTLKDGLSHRPPTDFLYSIDIK
jgi:nifR3 family TIM-barrel protein